MARATSEVLTGPGTLYTAPVATAFPTDPDTAPAGTWVDIGYSEDGWSIVIDKEFENIEVAEEVDPIDVRKVSQEGHVRGEAAQASLEVIQEAMGGGTIAVVVGPPALKTYVPPAADAFTKKALLFRGSAPTVGGAARKRDIQVSNAGATGGIESQYTKAPQKVLVALDFLMMKATAVDLFKIIDRTT